MNDFPQEAFRISLIKVEAEIKAEIKLEKARKELLKEMNGSNGWI